MFFANQKLRYRKILIIVIPLFVAMLVCGFFAYNIISSTLGFSSSIKKDNYDIELMDYHLRSNATEYQVELFNELTELVNDGTDDVAIAESVVKNFIADSYTWDNKKGQWDVGGMCYIYSPMKINLYLQMRDGFYGLLNKYIDEYGSDGLLEVSDIETVYKSKNNAQFEIEGKYYDHYLVCCKWTYTEDSRFSNKVDNYMAFDLIKNDDGRFEIVISHEPE